MQFNLLLLLNPNFSNLQRKEKLTYIVGIGVGEIRLAFDAGVLYEAPTTSTVWQAREIPDRTIMPCVTRPN